MTGTEHPAPASPHPTSKALGAYADGEGESVDAMRIEAHLRECAQCRTRAETLAALRTIAGSAVRYDAPPGLRDDVHYALDGIAGPAPRRPPRDARAAAWRWATGAMLAASLGALTLSALLVAGAPGAEERIAEEVTAAHIRSQLGEHAIDVAASDQHVVKPWLAQRLDFSPEVVDRAAQGFPLAGARVDYVDRRRVAALVYRRRDHAIDVFVWPADARADAPVVAAPAYRGYHRLHWVRDGFNWWAVSDLEPDELGAFVQALGRPTTQP